MMPQQCVAEHLAPIIRGAANALQSAAAALRKAGGIGDHLVEENAILTSRLDEANERIVTLEREKLALILHGDTEIAKYQRRQYQHVQEQAATIREQDKRILELTQKIVLQVGKTVMAQVMLDEQVLKGNPNVAPVGLLSAIRKTQQDAPGGGDTHAEA